MGAKMQPIRDMRTVQDIQDTLYRQTDPRGRREYLLWEIGIRMGLRVGDILDLRVGDLRGKKSYTYRPRKQRHKNKGRGVTITATIDPKLQKIIRERTEGMADGDWLFPSRTHTRGGNVKPITRQMAYLDMKRIGKLCGVEGMGCHTLRKTFGYHYYQRHKDVAFLQEWFDHADTSTTLIYIGITEDNFRKRTDASPFELPAGME